MSQKSPKTKILCGRCRVKESLAASATTMFLGWWGYVAFVWTLKALYTNAHGGEQHRENNLMLLNALGYQLFKAKRHEEAYRALSASFELSPTPKTREALDSLKPLFHPSQEKPFWERLGDFDLHPGYYHGPAGVVALCLLLLGFAVLKANSTSDTASTAPRPAVSYSQQPVQASPPAQEVSDRRDVRPGIDFKPVFSVPEEPLPNQGVLTLSDRVLFNKSTTAPLEVTTRSSDGHYVMKVQDWDTGEFVAKYFIRRGSTLSIELPLGAYKLKFASGDTWYGAEHLFGPTTSYSFVDEKMVFYQSGDSARGHRLDLIPQVGGNLKTPRMDAADW
ncbi:DUF4493 domain-containing protein [Pedosphaera parvula]|nr:DUF4493 domain-containing protein [Pedosphaera parvula]